MLLGMSDYKEYGDIIVSELVPGVPKDVAAELSSNTYRGEIVAELTRRVERDELRSPAVGVFVKASR